MRIRGSDREALAIRLHMTPMIDVVFLLLIFFVMTYQRTVREGDFSIRMPMAAADVVSMAPLEQPMYLTLTADDNRDLAVIEVSFGTQSVRFTRTEMSPDQMFLGLRQFVTNALAGAADPASASEIEAEIDAAYQLRYAETIRAVESISGYRTEDNQIVQLIERIKFRDASPP